MKKILLTLILTFQFGFLSAQTTPSELIIGTWRFEKECDLRSEKEKSKAIKEVIELTEIDIENGTNYPDRIFKENGEFEFYYNSSYSTYGNYNIKNQKLFIETRLSKEQIESNPKRVEWALERNLLTQKKDGLYYKPLILEIKSIDKHQLELGTENQYTVWRRIK